MHWKVGGAKPECWWNTPWKKYYNLENTTMTRILQIRTLGFLIIHRKEKRHPDLSWRDQTDREDEITVRSNVFLLHTGWSKDWPGVCGCEALTSSLFLEPRKCRATCSGSMLVTSASFQRLISYTFSFCSCTSIFHRNRVRASFSTSRQQQGLMLAFDQYTCRLESRCEWNFLLA